MSDEQPGLGLDDRNDEADALVSALWSLAPALHRNPTDTEVEAAEKIRDAAGSYRLKVLGLVARAGDRGMTPSEAIAALGGPMKVTPYSVRPRFTDLKELRLVRDSGKRRDNPRGNAEIVWVATSRARSVLERTGGTR